MARVFDRYVPKDSPLYDLQSDAWASRRGLWVDARPVPPWEWRRVLRRGIRALPSRNLSES